MAAPAERTGTNRYRTMRILRSRSIDSAGADPLLASRDALGALSTTLTTGTFDRAHPDPGRGRFGLAGVVTVLGLWVLLNVRYGYRLEDSVLYLPIAKQQVNPALYPDNPLIEHLRRMPYPLYKSMGRLLAGRLGVEGHVVAAVAMRLAFVGVLYAFMSVLTQRRWAGLLATLAAILQPTFYGTLAWTELISPEFVQSDLGKIVLMAAVIAYLRGRVVLTAVILGMGFHIHPIFSAATAAMLAPDAIWRWRRFGTRRMVASIVLGLVLAGPAAVGMFRSLSLGVTSPGSDHVEMIRFFNYFHVFPSLFHRWEYVWFFGLAGAGVVAFAMLAPRLAERRGTLLRFGLGVALWCGIGAVLAEVWPHSLAMQMMPFRLTYAVRLLATGLVVASALDLMLRGERRSFILAALWLATVMVAVKYVPWVTVVVALGLVARQRDRWSMLAVAAAVATAGAVAWIDPDQLPSLANLPWAAVLLVVAGLMVLRLERSGRLLTDEALASESWPFSHAGRIGWAAAIVVAGTVGLAKTSSGAWQPQLSAKPWLSPDGYDAEGDAWQGVMHWARTQTEPEEGFITPPDLLGWTYYSERNTVASYQLGMQSVWDRRYAPEARERLADLGATRPWAPGANYQAFAPNRLLALVTDYGVSYIVWKRTEPNRMPWPVAYINDRFLVYDVRSVTGDGTHGPDPTIGRTHVPIAGESTS